MDLLNQSDRDDFAILAAAAGFDPSDFGLTAIRDPHRPNLNAPRGTVTVVRKSNGIGATYAVNRSLGWLLTFEEDLRRGEFGVPL